MDRRRFRRVSRRLLIAAGLTASPALGQIPLPPTGPVAAPDPCPPGPLHRAARHVSDTVHREFIGDPALFHEPPLGTSLNEILAVQTGRADQHRFTLYQSDFLAGSTRLSPSGYARLTRMSRRLDGWLGPVLIEWTPEQPALAEQRRVDVLALLQNSGCPVGPERLAIRPSIYRGLPGDAAGLTYPIMIQRGARAEGGYALPPEVVIQSNATGGQ